ncbi:MAG: ATP-binding protein [bacterium]|nr:ATP-binding protein [bacterium]
MINILSQNPHWQGIVSLLQPKRRTVVENVLADLDTDLIALITGPRRVGKSVLLLQVLDHLIQDMHVSPKQILFYTFSPSDTSDLLESVFGEYIHEHCDLNKPFYLFFDEIQYLDGYEEKIKRIYDTYKGRAKLFLTGSLSLNYKRRMHESLAGRFFEYRMFPLFFDEYLYLKDDADYDQYKKITTAKDAALTLGFVKKYRQEFETFLTLKRLPETIWLTDEQSALYNENVKGQSLNQDAFEYFDIASPNTLQALFSYISAHNGLEFRGRAVAQKLAGVSEITISKYIDVLEIMGMVYIAYNTTNSLKKANSLRKIYLSSHNSDPLLNIGFAVESYVLEKLLSQKKEVAFYRKRQQEIDFLIPNEKIAIEVKYRSDTTHFDLTNMQQFSQAHGYQNQLITLNEYAESVELSKLPAMLL